MVLDSTLLAVKTDLSPDYISLPDLAEKVGMERETVRSALNLLIRLGLAEKIEHEQPRKSAKGGWVRVEYRSIANDLIANETTAIEHEA
jgi:predicted transcriptional regulator